mgnify:CR=1 FL=1
MTIWGPELGGGAGASVGGGGGGGSGVSVGGGGGGLVSLDETHEFRMQISGKTKAEQIRASGAQIVATPCANCKKQLRELMDYYQLPVQIVGVHDLVLRAIQL